MRNLPHTSSIRWPDQPFNYLRRTFPELSQAGLALLNGLLTYDADKRMTAAEALDHQYFRVRVGAWGQDYETTHMLSSRLMQNPLLLAFEVVGPHQAVVMACWGLHACLSRPSRILREALLSCLVLHPQERPFPRRPADMPTFPTPDTPAASAPRQPDAAAKQHIAEVIDATYAAAGLRPPRRGSHDGMSEGPGGMHGAAGVGHDDLPHTLYQRYDNTRERLEAPAAKRPRPSGGY